jgi:hypothetical protein
LLGRNEIVLSWTATTGASRYVGERSLDGLIWPIIAANVATTGYVDPDLGFSTTYYYRVLAASEAGDSAASSVVSARTAAQAEVLSAHAVVLSLAKKSLFNGIVATFTDANAAIAAARFIATINWGDGTVGKGRVSGANGAFKVSGKHKYARAGVFSVHVTISQSPPQTVTVSVNSLARVGLRAKHQPLVRLGRPHPLPKKLHRAGAQRER